MSLTCIPLITNGTECLFPNILTVCMTFWRNVSLSPLPIKKGSQSVVAFYIVWIVDSDTKVFSIIYTVFFFLDGILWYPKLNFYEVHELLFFFLLSGLLMSIWNWQPNPRPRRVIPMIPSMRYEYWLLYLSHPFLLLKLLKNLDEVLRVFSQLFILSLLLEFPFPLCGLCFACA